MGMHGVHLQPFSSSAVHRRRLPPTPISPSVSPHLSIPSATLTASATTNHLCLAHAQVTCQPRRSSTPRLLPTPPPTSPDFRSATTCLDRRPSGRLLPKPPPPHPLISSAPIASPEISALTPDPSPYTPEADFVRTDESSPSVEPIGDCEETLDVEEGETEWNSPHSLSAYDRMVEQGVPHKIISPSTSSLSPSIERVNSKSSGGSDGEDTAKGLGIDPSHYAPGAPMMNAVANGRSHSISSAHSALAVNQGSPNLPSTVAGSASFTENVPRNVGLGLIHCTLQHFPVRKRLRVNILKVEGLAGGLKADLEMHAQCKLSIPGLKGGKEQCSEVKRGRDTVFNQEFFFDNVLLEDLDTKSLHVGAYHHGGPKLGKEIFIGEIIIPLREIRELNTKKEVKMVEEIKQPLPKKFGKIHVTSCVERDARRLTINIKKADDLPRWGFLGAPDVCVKITLVQGSGLAKTKSSRILKNTTTAVYNEAVMFIFNPTKAELAHTKITISVHDMQRTCTGDDIIGCAYLGILGQDKSEMDQWKNTVEHMGKEYKGTHHLKHPSLNPPVVRVCDETKDEEPEDEEEREEGFEF